MSPSPEEIFRTLDIRLTFLNGPLAVAQPLAGLQFDSLDTLELLMVLDEIYGVRLTREDYQSLVTVGDLVQLIARRSTRGSPAS
jgi:acyl carrier protein